MPLQTPLTPEQLQKLAEDQITGEINSQIKPLESQVGQIGLNQGQAGKDLSAEFGTILPYVQDAAKQVEQSHQAAQEASAGIFTAAQGNLANLARQRAQEAQTLAQQIGGPVSSATFTEGVTPNQQYLAQMGSGQLLHGLAYGEAGNQLAQSFAGKVFPLVQTEQQAQLTRYFESQKKEIQDQINSIQGGKTKAINARLGELQEKERAYQLDVIDSNLAKTKAAHDWTATKKTLAQEQAKLKIAQDQFALDKTQLYGVDKKGNKTVAQKELDQRTAAQKKSDALEAKKFGLSEKELNFRKTEAAKAGKAAKAKQDLSMQEMAMSIIDNATNPGAGSGVTQTVTTEVTKQTGILNKSAYSMTDPETGEVHYFLDRKVTQPGYQGPAVQDPQKLYDMLIGYRVPPAMALKLVKSKLGTPDYAPGKTNYTVPQLMGMPFSEMRGVAIQLGFRPDPKDPKTKKELIAYITKAQKGGTMGPPAPKK